jgi:hypothetical protein
MDYIVRDPVIVNGVRRQRGDELFGDDAKAVEASASIRARCVPHRYNEQQKALAPVPSARKSDKGE